MNAILTCYLTGRPDPQRRVFWKPDDDDIVRVWIDSIRAVGLRGFIFHDCLSPKFIEVWSSPSVTFQKIDWKTHWTPAEERVQIYYDWIAAHPEYEKVLTTDLSDVQFYYDPFSIITDSKVLYVGSEPDDGKKWLHNREKATYWEITNVNKQLLNPGIVGGYRLTMQQFMCRWLDEMNTAPKPVSPPHDIVAFNRLIHRESVRYMTGCPLHTIFRANELEDSGAAIRHK